MRHHLFIVIFLCAAGLFVCTYPAKSHAGTTTGLELSTMSVITYNVFKAHGYYPKSGANILKKLFYRLNSLYLLIKSFSQHNAQIIVLQEAPSKTITFLISKLLGMKHLYFPGNNPGALFTSLQITASNSIGLNMDKPASTLFSNHCGRTLLSSGKKRIIVYNTHLPHNDRKKRIKEIKQIIQLIKSDLDSGYSLLLLGDLNHTPEDEEYKLWQEAGLTDAYATKGSGTPFTFRNMKPAMRIDYIWAGGPIANRIVSCRVLNESPYLPVKKTNYTFALSDHMPLIATFH